MGRPKRADAAGHCYHMLNRANLRATIFHKPGDYLAFEKLLAQAVEKFDIELFAYCLMPNHWHLVVRPGQTGEMGRFGQWLVLTHTQRYHAHHHTAGTGHLYQGRFKSFPVQSDDHFTTLCRYVERNAYSATGRLCDAPEAWPYGSLYHWDRKTAYGRRLLSPWPVRRRSGWTEWVAAALTSAERERLEVSMRRDSPFGQADWVRQTVEAFGLESTVRRRGRPKKLQKDPALA